MRLQWATKYDGNGDVVGFWEASTPNGEIVAEGDNPLEASMGLNIALIDALGM